jgi:hypothetical protein
MKKLLPFGAAIAMLGAVSCKKEYSCTCTTTDSSGFSYASAVTTTATLKKKKAEAWCSETTTTFGSFSRGCTLSN